MSNQPKLIFLLFCSVEEKNYFYYYKHVIFRAMILREILNLKYFYADISQEIKSWFNDENLDS